MLSDIGDSLSFTTMHFSADPRVAVVQLCGPAAGGVTVAVPASGPTGRGRRSGRRGRALALAAAVYLVLGVGLWWGTVVDAPDVDDHLRLRRRRPVPLVLRVAGLRAGPRARRCCTRRGCSTRGGINLLDDTSVVALGVVTAPVTWLWGPVASMNVALTLAPVLSALAMYVLLRRWVSWAPAAFLGGLAYGFSPFVVTELALNQLNIAFLAVPPLVVLVLADLLVTQRRAPWRNGLALAGLVVVQFFVSTEVLVITVLARRPSGSSWWWRGRPSPSRRPSAPGCGVRSRGAAVAGGCRRRRAGVPAVVPSRRAVPPDRSDLVGRGHRPVRDDRGQLRLHRRPGRPARRRCSGSAGTRARSWSASAISASAAWSWHSAGRWCGARDRRLRSSPAWDWWRPLLSLAPGHGYLVPGARSSTCPGSATSSRSGSPWSSPCASPCSSPWPSTTPGRGAAVRSPRGGGRRRVGPGRRGPAAHRRRPRPEPPAHHPTGGAPDLVRHPRGRPAPRAGGARLPGAVLRPAVVAGVAGGERHAVGPGRWRRPPGPAVPGRCGPAGVRGPVRRVAAVGPGPRTRPPAERRRRPSGAGPLAGDHDGRARPARPPRLRAGEGHPLRGRVPHRGARSGPDP